MSELAATAGHSSVWEKALASGLWSDARRALEPWWRGCRGALASRHIVRSKGRHVGVDNPYVHVLSRLAHRALVGIPACHRSCAVGARAVEIPTCRLRTPQLAAYVPTPSVLRGRYTWPEPGKCVNPFDCLWTQRYICTRYSCRHATD